MLEATHQWLMALRPMSQMLRLAVIPEIDRRVAAGALDPGQLPFQILQFRWIQADGKQKIEINDDVKLTAKVKLKRAPIAAGELLTLNDIDPNECYLERPTIDGKPAAYFFSRSSFMNFQNIFDFTPNAPDADDHDDVPPMRFAVAEYAQAKSLFEAIQPIAKYQQLSDANWPPGPAYYPNVLWHLRDHPDSVKATDFGDVVAKAYNEEYLKGRLDLWAETKCFDSARFAYVSKAINEYLAGDYVCAIYVLVPHFEGIIKDYLTAAGVDHRYRLESCVEDLRRLVLSRKALLFPRKVLDLIFEFIADGPFLAETKNINDPAVQVTRHGVAHGRFMGFEGRDIALKYLILLDALSYVILHDKLLTGTF
jgi:hypothetical protein